MESAQKFIKYKDKKKRMGNSYVPPKDKKKKVEEVKEKKEDNQCIIKIKCTDGSVITCNLPLDGTIGDISKFVQQNSSEKDDFLILTTYPKKIYTQSDHKITLKDAQLLPKGSVIIQNKDAG